MVQVSDVDDTAVYRTVCDCGWSYENRAYGKVEDEAMSHVDHAGLDHHASEPEKVNNGA